MYETISSHAQNQALQARSDVNLMYETISSHAQIQALQARSDENLLVILVSLESVRIACDSYALLRPLMEPRLWVCTELDLLSIVAGLSLELQKLEHDLLPQLMVPEAKLERGLLEALLAMKSSAITLLNLGKSYDEILGDVIDEEHISARVKTLSVVLTDTVVYILEGTRNIAWIQEDRVQWLVQQVTALLATPVRFSDFE